MLLSSFYTYPSPGTLMAMGLQAFRLRPKHRQGIRAWRYYDGTIYDKQFGMEFEHPFTEWDEVKQGRRPVVVPLSKRIVEIGAQALFSECPRFVLSAEKKESSDAAEVAPEKNELQNVLDEILRMNSMEDKYLPEARACAVEGESHWKFAWTPQNKRRPVAIMTFSAHEVYYERDPLDDDVVLMARIQFKYRDNDNEYWLYREEWTPDTFTLYKKLKVNKDADTRAIDQMGKNGQWPIEELKPNPFKVIPLTPVYNRRMKSDNEGYGDYWDIFDKFDQYNTKHWLEHRSDQLDGNPNTIFINCDLEGSLDPGDTVLVRGEGASVVRLASGNALRPDARQSKVDLRKEIFDAVGYDDVDPAAITNKGALTRAVFELVFAKTLKTTAEKQRHWGECGLCQFLGNLLYGLSQLRDARQKYPALKQVEEDDTSTYVPTIVWPDIFRVTPDERSATLTDLVACIDNGFLTRERAVEIAADLWGIDDVTTLLEELKDTHEQMQATKQAEADTATAAAETATKQAAAPLPPPKAPVG